MLLVQGRLERASLFAVTAVLLRHNVIDIRTACSVVSTGLMAMAFIPAVSAVLLHQCAMVSLIDYSAVNRG